MSPARRRQMVEREHPSLSLVRQCALLGISRSSIYYRPRAASPEDLSLMGEVDRQYLETPFFGSRRMKAWLERQGMPISRKRVQRLMRAMGLRAIYRQPRTSRPAPEHPVYPYLPRNARITRPNQSLPPRRRGCGPRTSPTCPWPGLGFTHFKRRRRGNLQSGGTGRLGVPAYRGWLRTVKNPLTPATGGGAPGRWHPRKWATACHTKLRYVG